MLNYMKKNNVFLSLSVSMLIMFTVFIFGVIDIYSSNINEFWFSLTDILPYSMFFFIIGTIIICFFLQIVPRKWYNYLVSISFGLGLAIYIQGNWMLFDYGLLNGNQIPWKEYIGYGILNSFIWAVCILLPFVLVKMKKINELNIFKYLSFSILGIEIFTICFLTVSTGFFKNGNASFTITDKDLLEFSTDKNIVLFVVDECDAKMMNNVLAESPEYADKLDGFTYFNNTSGKFPWTVTALADIITGIPYDNKTSYKDYINESYKSSELLNGLQDNQYEVGIYTSMKPAISSNANYIKNLEFRKEEVGDKNGLVTNFYQLVAYRYAPHFAKNNFWFSSESFEMYKSFEKGSTGNSVYRNNDNLFFYDNYCNQELSLDNNKQYKVIHIWGCHGPRVFNEHLENDENGTTAEQSLKGCINMLSVFLEQMKKQDIYDNSYIMILGDHGSYGKRQNPTLMIKPFNTKEKFKVSNAPITYDDIPYTLLNAMNSNTKNINIFDIQEDEHRERYYNYHDWVSSSTIDKILTVTTLMVGEQAMDESSMVVSNIIYDKQTLKQMKLIEDTKKINNASVNTQLNSEILQIVESPDKTEMDIRGWAVLPNVESKECKVFLGFENGGQEKIYSMPKIVGSQKPIDIDGNTSDLYNMGSFVLKVPLNEFFDADYKLNVYLESEGEIYKAKKSPVMKKREGILKLLRPGTVLDTDDNYIRTVAITDGNIIEEEVYSKWDSLSKIAFRTITWNREYGENDTIFVEIFEKDTMEKIYEQKIQMRDVKDNKLFDVNLNGLQVKKDVWYKIRFTSNVDDADKSVSLMSGKAQDLSCSKCVVDGGDTNEDICISIISE